jgi:DNA polymerase (family 10)
MLLSEALLLGEKIIAALQKLPEVIKIELAGSLRRKKETIGDVDVLIAAKHIHRKKIVGYFTNDNMSSKVMAKGDTKASIILKESHFQADLRIVEEEEWGAALQYFTGSKEHNIHLRKIAKEKGYKISEYGIFNIYNDTRKASKKEEDIYATLNMELIPPEMREDKGEIDLALQHKIPKLVELKDIKGDLQMHSNWSDGLQSIEDLSDYVRKNFTYQFIAITDHSKSSRIAGGMDDKEFQKQIEAIKKVNEDIGTQFVKSGAEVDILSNGSLDLSDEVLEQLDWVTASIHSGFNQSKRLTKLTLCFIIYVSGVGIPIDSIIGYQKLISVSCCLNK